MTTPNPRPRLVDFVDLERSLSSDHGPLDEGLAVWAIETVSARAVEVTERFDWSSSLDVPAGAAATIGLAVRRLYTNPDRMTREGEGDYNYGLDASVTKADVFTPAEEQSLRRYAATRRGPKGLGTVSTSRGDEYMPHGETVPSQGGQPFPWYRDGYPYGWR